MSNPACQTPPEDGLRAIPTGAGAVSRRFFLERTFLAGIGVCGLALRGQAAAPGALPVGGAPAALDAAHFPSRLHAFVWRNWQLVPLARMGEVVGARASELRALGQSMGLGEPPMISREIRERSFITVIRRNWHLLPYDQLLTLLGWTAARLEFTLREDDFLFVKLGSLKPMCPPLRWSPPTAAEAARAAEIAAVVGGTFTDGPPTGRDPLFGFVERLSRPSAGDQRRSNEETLASSIPRFCYSYFALYGDALLDPALDPYPEGYLARLADCGVNGVWLQGLLARLSPFPWDERVSARFEERREQLNRLVARAASRGVKVYLYLNEPRARPLGFFDQRPELKGVVEGDHATLCTTTPEVRRYLTEATASLCRAVPGLGGFFTITASENLTNCWSHQQGSACPRCGSRGPAEVISQVHDALLAGIRLAEGQQTLIAWDWGWADAWADQVIERLPPQVSLMSVSEWDLPIERGGVPSRVGEYCLSALGPGPRARKHWAKARQRGHPIYAKLQVANTWELAAVPYIPAVAQAWAHGRNLRAERISGLMLGWTLGGHPSPNLDAAAAGLAGEELESVARRWHGEAWVDPVAAAWRAYSRAFGEFPFHVGTVYHAPWHMGPANLLWQKPTGYAGTMVGLPYDDVERWRSIYPLETWCAQLERVADGFEAAAARLGTVVGSNPPPSLMEELRFAKACAIQWRSAATQARWIDLRDSARPDQDRFRALLSAEIDHARRLHELQSSDSRIGFEASNHYFYIPLDLVEKVVNCRWLLEASG